MVTPVGFWSAPAPFTVKALAGGVEPASSASL